MFPLKKQLRRVSICPKSLTSHSLYFFCSLTSLCPISWSRWDGERAEGKAQAAEGRYCQMLDQILSEPPAGRQEVAGGTSGVCVTWRCALFGIRCFFFLIMCDVFVSRTTSGSLILTVRRSWRGREGTMRKRRRKGGRVLCCLDLRIHLTPLQARKKRYVYCVVIHWTNLQNILMQYHSIISEYSRWNSVVVGFFFLSFPGALFVPTRLLWSQSCVPGWPELCHTGRDNTHIDSYKGVGCSGSRSERFPRNSSPRLVKAFVRFTIFSQLDVGWFRQSN